MQFGGAHDQSLVEWASRPDVAVIRRNATTGRWELNNPLKPTANMPGDLGVDPRPHRRDLTVGDQGGGGREEGVGGQVIVVDEG